METKEINLAEIADKELELKKIVLTYNEAQDLMKACCEPEEKNKSIISRDFLDWYLIEESFICKQGVFVLENVSKDNRSISASFDLSNPERPNFKIYDPKTGYNVCGFRFIREENLTMVNLNVKYDYLIEKKFNSLGVKMVSTEYNRRFQNSNKELDALLQIARSDKKAATNSHLSKRLNSIRFDVNDIYKETCESVIYCFYATMYHFSKKHLINPEPNEHENKEFDLQKDTTEKTVKRKYTYTGFVKIDNTYRPVIKKGKDEPVREYERRIESWSVRGHYRRVSGGLIWIDPHVKGSGNLEARVYGTSKQDCEKHITEKVFNIEKKILIAPQLETQEPIEKESVCKEIKSENDCPKSEVPVCEEKTQVETGLSTPKITNNQSIISKIISFFKRFKTSQHGKNN